MIFERIWIMTLLILWMGAVIFDFKLKKVGWRVWIYRVTVLLQMAWVVYRAVLVQHVPFSGIYESMVFFSTLYALKIIFGYRGSESSKRWLILPVIFLLIGTLFLPADLWQPNPLVPALQSFWIYIHVPAFFVAYVSLTMSFVLAVMQKVMGDLQYNVLIDSELAQSVFWISTGIITGAFWAQQAWGTFWSWDPKETWALITWLILMAGMHVRSTEARFWILLLAFGAMLFTYFGVMWLLPGLHSYI